MSQKSYGRSQRHKLWLGSHALINALGLLMVAFSSSFFFFFFALRLDQACFLWSFLNLIYFPDFLDGENGYIMVTANGGINQQRVAVSILLLCPSSCLLKFLYHHIMRPRDTFHRYVISLL